MAALLSYRNFIDDEATILKAQAGAVAASGHPLSNLKLRGLGQFFMITNPGPIMSLSADFGTSRSFNLIAVAGMNQSAGGIASSATIEVDTSPNGTTWTEIASQTFVDLAPVGLPSIAIAVLDQAVSSQHVRARLNWAGGADVSRAARFWIDNALLVKNKVVADARFGANDAGQLDKTDGQQYVAFTRPRTKQSEFSFRGLSTLEAWGFADGASAAQDVASMNGLQFSAGLTGEVIVLPKITGDASRGLWIRRAGVYGHLEAPLPTISQDGTSETWSASVRVLEER
jgi:hypothetical protein